MTDFSLLPVTSFQTTITTYAGGLMLADGRRAGIPLSGDGRPPCQPISKTQIKHILGVLARLP